jgi:hypothetical protein
VDEALLSASLLNGQTVGYDHEKLSILVNLSVLVSFDEQVEYAARAHILIDRLVNSSQNLLVALQASLAEKSAEV